MLPKVVSQDAAFNSLQTQWAAILDPIIKKVNSETDPSLSELFTTKGDLATKNATSVVRQAVGVDGQWLRADSTQPTGMNWVNLGMVAQWYFTGASAVWSTTSNTLGAFADGASLAPSLELSGVIGTPQVTAVVTPKVTVNSLPAGSYLLLVTGSMTQDSGTAGAHLALNDGTTTAGTLVVNTGTGGPWLFSLQAAFSYAAAGNKTFEIYGRIGSSNTLSIDTTGAGNIGRVVFTLLKLS